MFLVKVIRDRMHTNTVAFSCPLPMSMDSAEWMKRKLMEEVGEYLLNPSVAELADILAVLKGLSWHELGAEWSEIETECKERTRESGDFQTSRLQGLWVKDAATETDA